MVKMENECLLCADRTGYPHYFRSRRQLNIHHKEMHKKKKAYRKHISEEVKLVVLARDNNVCTKCRGKNDLHVHHIVHREHGGNDDPSNLTTLCDLCHAEEHRGEPVYNLMIKSLFKQVTI